MSAVKEMILFAAGLMVTVFVCGISFRIYERAEVIGEKIVEREERSITDIMEYELTRYDNSEIDGSHAISYIRRAYSEYGASITVTNAQTTFTVDTDTIEEIRDTESGYYINPLKKYNVNVNFDENDVIDKITIDEITTEQKRG